MDLPVCPVFNVLPKYSLRLSPSKLLTALTGLTRQLDYPESRIGGVKALHMPQGVKQG